MSENEDQAGVQAAANVSGDGQTPATPASESPTDVARFTQADLERILADRLSRERAKYEGFEELQARAEKWDEYEEAQKSELVKAQEAAAKAIREREVGLREANERLLRAAFLAEAGKVRAKHPEDAFRLSDTSNVSVTDDGDIVGVGKAVQSLVESGRLTLVGRPPAPDLDAGAGSGEPKPTGERLSDAELATARNLGVSPEEYAKYKT